MYNQPDMPQDEIDKLVDDTIKNLGKREKEDEK